MKPLTWPQDPPETENENDTDQNTDDEEYEEDLAINDKSDIFTICERVDEDMSHEMIDNEILIESTEKSKKLLKLNNIFSLTKMKKLK